MRLELFEPLKEEEMFNDCVQWLLPACEEPNIIGNESNCDLECSQSEQEIASMQTLKIPARKAKK